MGTRVKATYQMDPASLTALEHERLKRINAGIPRSQCDLSDLINEAVLKAFAAPKRASK